MTRVLVVDDEPMNLRLFEALLAPEGYELECADCGEAALAAVARRIPDLVLLDLAMPGMGGLGVLEALKASERTRLTPVVVVTASTERAQRLRGIALGADEFLTKPIDRAEVRTRLRALLRLKEHMDQMERTENVLLSMARAVEARDPHLPEHCERMAAWVQRLGETFGLDAAELRTLRLGAHLHDIGKIAIPDAVLLKPGPLTIPERAMMRTHAEIGESILAPLASLAPVLPLVRHHHERLDGSGYPDRLAGAEVPQLVRILAVADVFDALTTSRPYRQALAADEAMGVLRAEVGRGWWDGEVVERLAGEVAAGPREPAVLGRQRV